ncbi:hypothetical protein PINS_up020165 [Pythium insidiosum]|nr:hypothetical protein PINS_up020165 [Pythium insidiosum]
MLLVYCSSTLMMAYPEPKPKICLTALETVVHLTSPHHRVLNLIVASNKQRA